MKTDVCFRGWGNRRALRCARSSFFLETLTALPKITSLPHGERACMPCFIQMSAHALPMLALPVSLK